MILCSSAVAAMDERGLIAHYTFGEGSGPVLKDKSGNKNDGKIVGAAWVKGEKGAALDFDGTHEFVDCGDEVGTRLRGPLTVSAWIRPVSRGWHHSIVSRGDWNLVIGPEGKPDGVPAFQVRAVEGSLWHGLETVSAKSPVPLNEWTHIAGVYDPGRKCVEIFVNGELSDSKPKTDGSVGGIFRSRLILGKKHPGLIGEVRLYQRALSADEIKRLYQTTPMDRSLVSPEHRLGIRPHLFVRTHKVAVEFYLREIKAAPRPVTFDATLLRAGTDQVVQQQTVKSAVKNREPEVTFSLPDPAAGDYEIRANAKDAAGKLLGTASCTVKVPPTPRWFDSKAGVSDNVLPPWTPLNVQAGSNQSTTVECWGRSYHFGANPFPVRIMSGGMDLLAGPIRLVGRVKGRDIEWKSKPIRLEEQSPAKVMLFQEASDPAIKLSVTTLVEYDGLIRLDCALTPIQAAQLEKLVLEIPLRQEHVSLVYQLRDRQFKAPGALPKEGIVRDFNPAIWMGDEKRGLQWFTESDQDWYLADLNRAIEIATEGEKVVMRLNLVTQPVELQPGVPRTVQSLPGLSYTFGLQATPLKPVTRNAWDYRITAPLWYNDQYGFLTNQVDGKPGIDYIAEKGARTLFLTAPWTDIHGAPECVGYADELHRLVKACHKRGIQVTVYLGNIFTDFAPEYPAFLDDFIGWSRSTPYSNDSYPCNVPPRPTYMAYGPCLRSDWQDMILDGSVRLMKEFDIDGFYLDGFGLAGPCYNRHHGCGYFRPDGSVGPTYAFFAGRDAIRRLYTIVRSHKPDGQIDLHAAATWFSPVMTWATTVWDGETILGDRRTPPERKGVHLLEYLPPDRFRGQFLGNAWGVPTEFLDYYVPYSFERQYAIVLLHDMPIRAYMKKEGIDFNARLWQVFDAFDRKGAEWLPYWNNSEFVSVQPAGAYVSLYRYPKNGVLAVVSNLAKEKAQVNVTFVLNKLGLSEKSTAINALTKEPISIEKGKITLDLDSVDWRLVWIKP